MGDFEDIIKRTEAKAVADHPLLPRVSTSDWPEGLTDEELADARVRAEHESEKWQYTIWLRVLADRGAMAARLAVAERLVRKLHYEVRDFAEYLGLPDDEAEALIRILKEPADADR